jgi:hypothetical protein
LLVAAGRLLGIDSPAETLPDGCLSHDGMPSRKRPIKVGRYLAWNAAVLLGLLFVTGVILAVRWPFTQEELVRTLEHLSSSEVRVGSFRQTFFPNPGYVAGDITFLRRSNAAFVELASVKRLECRASWMTMLTLTRRAKEMRIELLRVYIPAPVPPPMNLYPALKEETTVTKLVADGAILEIAPRHDGGRSFRFDFPQLKLGEVEKKKSIAVRTVLHNPEPPGDIAVTAKFGPLDQGNIGRTPLSGSFNFTQGDLSVFHVIKGMLASHGTFQGTLARCETRGNVLIPDFEVTSSRHKVGLSAEFYAVVDGLRGDVAIQSANAHLLRTTLQAKGSIGRTPGQDGKSVALDIDAQRARIEDLLRLFVTSDRPPVSGPITLRAKVILPPGKERFLRKLRLDGNFRISDARFTHENTQRKVDELSERARGRKSNSNRDGSNLQHVLSRMEGQVHVRNAIAALSQATFAAPGAVAQGEGNYDLLTEEINLHGKLAMQATLSKAAGGFKSILLLPLDPFFKKQHAGAVLPVRVTGSYARPVFKVSLTGKK